MNVHLSSIHYTTVTWIVQVTPAALSAAAAPPVQYHWLWLNGRHDSFSSHWPSYGGECSSNELFWLISCFDNVDLCRVLNRFCTPLEVSAVQWSKHKRSHWTRQVMVSRWHSYCLRACVKRLIFILIHTLQVTLKLLDVIFVINFFEFCFSLCIGY